MNEPLVSIKVGERKNPELSELAWLAGIIDGEGSIHAYTYKRKNGDHRPLVKVGVTNTHWKMIEKVKELFGRISGRHYKASRNNHLQRPHRQERWTVFINRKNSVVDILSAVLPYLVAKQEQALRAIELCKREHRRMQTIDPHLLDLVAQIKWLNHNSYNLSRIESVETVRWSPAGQETVQANVA